MGNQSACCKTLKKQLPQIDENETVQSRGALNIVYGTTGGNSGRLAANLLAESKSHGYAGKLIHLGDFDSAQFLSMKRIIFIVSTYGSGGPTNDAKPFFAWLEALENGSNALAHVSYTVFGLGNSTFTEFAGFGTKVNEKLEQLGAKSVYPFAKGDAANDTTDQDFNAWKTNIWNVLDNIFPLEKITRKELRAMESGIECEEIADPSLVEQDWDTYVFEEGKIESKLREYFNATCAPINEIRELRQKPQDSSCLHVDLTVDNYTTAGNIGVYPQNSMKLVNEFAQLNGYTLTNSFKLTALTSTTRLPVPSPMKVSTFLTQFCDFLGPVNKTLVQGLAAISQNEQFIAKTEQWVRDSDAFEKEIKDKHHSIYSLCVEYGFRVPLGTLIQLSNRIAPRFYTIGSSAKAHPKNVQFCVSLLQVSTHKEGEKRLGIASQFFNDLKEKKAYVNKKIRIFNQESLFMLPRENKTPLIMIGPGAGIAPFRAFLQEKKYLKKNNSENQIGECALYFGCRGRKVDYIYSEELQAFEKEGVCDRLRVAFSRDGNKKVYVQDLLNEDIDIVADAILTKNANIYVCGSKAVGEAVKEFIINLYAEKEGLIPYLAYSKIDELQEEKRLLMEVWG